MHTTVISGFPGIGKSYCTKQNANFLDIDPAKYSWSKSDDGKKERSSIFPARYINHIKSLIGEAPVIFVSSHKKVREALLENSIDFVLVYPERELKQEYIQRYRDRGSEHPLISRLAENWDTFIDDMDDQQGCTKIQLKSGQFLNDVLPLIHAASTPPYIEQTPP